MLSPSNVISLQSGPLVSAHPPKQQLVEPVCPDLHCEVRRRETAPGNDQLYDTHTHSPTHTYNESWPTTSSCCSSQQIPPTSHAQRSVKDMSMERALEFEKEREGERKPSLARCFSAYHKATNLCMHEIYFCMNTPIKIA